MSTRLCPRCNVIIERSQGCDSFGCICGHTFHYSSAPRVTGFGLQNFDKVVDRAVQLQLPLNAVVQHARVCSQICLLIKKYDQIKSLVTSTGLSFASAELALRARNGDQAAIKQLRQDREARKRHRKIEQIVVRLQLNVTEAEALLDRAHAGDEAAWALVRQARISAAHEPVEVSAASSESVDM